MIRKKDINFLLVFTPCKQKNHQMISLIIFLYWQDLQFYDKTFTYIWFMVTSPSKVIVLCSLYFYRHHAVSPTDRITFWQDLNIADETLPVFLTDLFQKFLNFLTQDLSIKYLPRSVYLRIYYQNGQQKTLVYTGENLARL